MTTSPSLLLPDRNGYVYAFRSEAVRHGEDRTWPKDRLAGDELVAVSEVVLSSVIRVTTSHRVFPQTSSPSDALASCDAVLRSPTARPVRAGPRHWDLFTGLGAAGGATGDLVPDAHLAALAIEHGASPVTDDRGTHRWPGLGVLHPLDGQPSHA